MYSTRHGTNLAFVLVQFTYITITSLRNKQKTAASARRVTILYTCTVARFLWKYSDKFLDSVPNNSHTVQYVQYV